jgi:hypothetical protein
VVLGLSVGRWVQFGHDLKDPIAALLGLVELKVEFRSVLNVQGLVDL